MTIGLAEPTELGRFGWVLLGLDTDRNQRSGGMHGSEAIVFVNGERAVLFRLGRGATLRQHADTAPDHGVFAYPAGLSHGAPPPSRVPASEKR